MFIRKKKSKVSTSVQIVENKRIWKTTKQTVLKYVWARKNEDEVGIRWLLRLAEYIKCELEQQTQGWMLPLEWLDKWTEETIEKRINKSEKKTYNVNIYDLEEEWRIIKWISDIYGSMYSQLWFNNIFWTKKKTQNYANILKQITLARIAWPKSKRATVEMLGMDYWVQLNLNNVYKMMKWITDKKIEEIQDIAFKYTKWVLNEKINVLFMDGTTLYFESQNEDWFREKWYSKDWKFSETQVALTLLVTESWLPIWYKLYHGSHYEWNSLQDTIEEIEKKYEINKVVLVADSWFLNQKNTDYLENRGNKYIMWARIKNTTKKLQKIIVDKSWYIITKKDSKWNMIRGYREIDYKEKKMIVTYSKKRAKKDKIEREKNIKKLLKKEWQKVENLISNFGYKKFLKQNWEDKIEIDTDKIEKAEQWDWLHGVITNDNELDIAEIMRHYRWLRQVEESFRINKHDLLIRPIFHWNEQKIRAHIAIAFMAFTLVRHLEYRLRLSWYKYSPEIVRRELLKLQWSIVYEKGREDKKWLLPSSISKIWQDIYKSMWKKWNNSVQDLK